MKLVKLSACLLLILGASLPAFAADPPNANNTPPDKTYDPNAKIYYLGGVDKKCKNSNRGLDVLSTRQIERSLTCMTNLYRKNHGRKEVRTHSVLVKSSRSKTRRLVKCKTFGHTPCNDRFDKQIVSAGYMKNARSWNVGENLVYTFGENSTPANMMKAWINSDGHRINILNHRWRDIGIGAYKGSFLGYPSRVVATQHFGFKTKK